MQDHTGTTVRYRLLLFNSRAFGETDQEMISNTKYKGPESWGRAMLKITVTTRSARLRTQYVGVHRGALKGVG